MGICVEESACSCDGLAHGIAKVWRGECDTVSVPLYGCSSGLDAVTEQVQAKEAAAAKQMQSWNEHVSRLMAANEAAKPAGNFGQRASNEHASRMTAVKQDLKPADNFGQGAR